MTIAEDVSNFLTQQGYSNIRAYNVDPAVEKQIVIIPRGGTSVKTLNGVDIQEMDLQIQVHDTSLKNGETTALEIISVLNNSFAISNTVYVYWTGRYPDYWINDNKNHVFSTEFKIIKVV